MHVTHTSSSFKLVAAEDALCFRARRRSYTCLRYSSYDFAKFYMKRVLQFLITSGLARFIVNGVKYSLILYGYKYNVIYGVYFETV